MCFITVFISPKELRYDHPGGKINLLASHKSSSLHCRSISICKMRKNGFAPNRVTTPTDRLTLSLAFTLFISLPFFVYFFLLSLSPQRLCLLFFLSYFNSPFYFHSHNSLSLCHWHTHINTWQMTQTHSWKRSGTQSRLNHWIMGLESRTDLECVYTCFSHAYTLIHICMCVVFSGVLGFSWPCLMNYYYVHTTVTQHAH